MPVKTLQMVFLNQEGRNVTFSIADPVEPVDPTAVESAMDLITERNLFVTTGGDVVEKVAARLISREVTDIVSF